VKIGAVLDGRIKKHCMYPVVTVSLPTAIDYVLRCTPKYRLPETTRIADKLASAAERYRAQTKIALGFFVFLVT